MGNKYDHPVHKMELLRVNGWEVQPLVVQNEIEQSEIERLAQFLTQAINVDPEYDLEGVAKMVIHPGRRGITGNLYYVGRWVDTFELFHLSCYRFHKDPEYELMTHENPIMCSHDVKTVASVMFSFANATVNGTLDRSVFFGQ